jgi:hypothetical protein
MSTYLYRAALKSLILASALVVAQSGSLLAQQNTLAQPALSATQPVPVGTPARIEVASLDPLPAAPGYETLTAHEPILPMTGAAAAVVMIAPVEEPRRVTEPHRFWDRENSVLFAGVAAAATADFFTTHANLASGGRELNPVTRVLSGSTAGLAANFGLETAGVIGVSYLFHKTGHHTLERMTSFVNIGSSAVAVGYGLTHR